LRITQQYTGSDYNFKRVLPDYAVKYITPESLMSVEKELNDFMLMINIGEYPKYSILFNLGKKLDADNFIVPYMLKAYENGLKVAPLLDVVTLCKLRHDLELYGYNFALASEWGMSLNDYITADICIVQIDAGTKSEGLDSVKGLMQLRASKGKPTFIITHVWGSRVLDLCSEDDDKCMYLAHLVSVEYIERKREESQTGKVSSQNVGYNPSPGFDTSGYQLAGSRSSNNISRASFSDLTKDKYFSR